MKHNFHATKLFTSLIVAISILLIALPVFSQTTGTVSGVVTNEDGNGLPGANISIKGTSLGAATDLDGKYVINKVPPGQYTLVVTFMGYRSTEKEIAISADADVTADFALAEDVLLMDAVVVTGTPGGVGIRKRDASFAINTVDATEMERLSPSSTAAVLDIIPGVWSESTGGVAGANIMVRGLPSGGDAPFVTMSINGGPVYGVETLSFLEQSTLFRVDETIELTEASRGGPSAVFSNGEPGMTVNFNLKKGGEKTEGRLKYQTSDYNLQRIDGILSGKISDGLYYMAGGYVKTSPGVRSTQFNAENGKQFTMQLTKVFKKGALNFFTRLTDDYGQWILPMALETGNDLGTFSPLGNANRFRTLQINTQGDSSMFDFSKGRGWKGSVSGLSANFDLGAGWMVSDVLTYTSGDANTFGFVPNGNPIKVSALGLGTVQTRGGKTLSSSDYVQNYGHWVVMKDIESLNNDLSLNKIWNAHKITMGLYQARWSSEDFWTLGNHVPVHNVTNGDFLEDDITAQNVADAGGGGSWNYGLQYAGDARVFAIYGADSWQIMPALRFDLGLRYELFDLQYTLDHGSLPDGQVDVAESLSGKDLAFTGAVNYDFTKELGVFARYSDSYLFPNFDLIRENKYSLDSDGNVEANGFSQYEMGVKYTSKLFSLFATGFYNSVVVIEGGVGSVRESELLKTKTMGVELDGALSINNFMLRAVGTFQKGEITDSDVDDTVVGNSIWRQPDLQLRVAPSYNLSFGNYDAVIYGALRHAGKRWDSIMNVYQLDSYTKIDAGVVVSTPGGMSFGIHADNLTDCEGLTEGDPRDPASANGRPLFGRSIKFSITHDF
ncbi:TonB-dependent receptor [candidate division KSB1 bacterium]|nr:TonB-dependent receptor [candidate division KSB1 bacterium]